MRFLLVILVGAALVGCGASTGNLKSRASYDLDCPESELQVTEIDRITMGVKGCGQKAVYQTNCTNPLAASYQCTWHLNADVKGK